MWSRVATAYERSEDYAEAMAAWEKARALRKQDNHAEGALEALEGMARMTRKQGGEPALAVSYYQEALVLAEQLGNHARQGNLHNSIGIVHWQQGVYEQAVLHYEQALRLFVDLDDQIHAGLMLNSLGVTLTKMGRHEEASQRLDEAVTLHRQTGQRQLEGHALAAWGDVYF